MGTTTPINGLPTPDDNSPNDPPIHFGALNTVLDTRLVPQFASVATRNSAIPSPVTGMVCCVNGYPQVYRSGAWRGISPLIFEGAKKTVDTAYTADSAITSVTIPDPGYSYRIDVSGALWGFCSAGSTWNLQYRLDNAVTGTLIPTPTAIPPSSTNTSSQVIGPRGISQPLTGSHILYWSFQKITGPTGSGAQVTGDPNLQSYVAVVIPV